MKVRCGNDVQPSSLNTLIERIRERDWTFFYAWR